MAKKKEIVINATDTLTRIAITEDDTLAELFLENPENERTIGNICLARVRRIMPSIRAAFVDIGQKQDAFLHFSDLSEHLPEQLKFVRRKNPRIEDFAKKPADGKKGKRKKPSHGKGGNKKGGNKGSKKDQARNRGKRRSAQKRSKGRKGRRRSKRHHNLQKHLKNDQHLLVKISKEPISNKGSRVSTDISLAGRFLVLIPFGDYVAVSKKIESYKERKRLRTLARSLLPEGFGLIIRTVAEGRNAKALDTDLSLLVEKWRAIEEKLQGSPKAPLLLHEDVNMVSSIMRDIFTDDYDRVLIDDERLHRNIKSYIHAVAPQMAENVKLHKGNRPIFEAAGIAKNVAEAFEERVELPSGGYLFIEQTEAMHVIDVNSGRSGRGMSQEDSSVKCNLEAARVIAHQLRLRDLGGIIVIDFIDLRSRKNRKKIYDELVKEFKKDRAVTKVLPMSDFGVVQITRQRLRPSFTKTFEGPKGGTSDNDDEDKRTKSKKPAAKQNGRSARNGQNGKADGKSARPSRKQPERKSSAPATAKAAPSSKRSSGGKQEDAPAKTPAPAKKTSGNGKTPAAKELVQDIEKWITNYRAQGNHRAVTLKVHPFTAAYLNRKVPTYPTRWFIRHLVRVRLESNDQVPPSTFRFFDTRTGEALTDRVQTQES